MKKLIYQTALIAYVNAICFRNFRPTCTKISEQYNRNIIYDSENSPYVSHDRLRRLLVFEGKWKKYIQKHYSQLIKLRKSSSEKKTYLIIDYTMLAKPYSKELDLLSRIFSPSDRRYLYGINIVFVIWTDGQTRFPIGFRIWKKNDKKTKIDLAMELLKDAKKTYKVKPSYVLMDSFYPAAKLLKLIRKFGWHWIAKIKSNRLIDNIQIQEFFSYRYGNHIGNVSENIRALVVKDNDNYWATSDLSLQSSEVKHYYRNRQIIEEFHKILKSELRLEGCSSRESIAQINHIYFVLIAFCHLELFRTMKNIQTIYKVRAVLFDCVIPKNLNWKLNVMPFA
jgi:Transposase DDE domain